MPTLLIVDDDPDIRFLLRELVAATEGRWEVVGEAASGEEAIARWRELRPDAVVLDQRMPGLSGLEAAARILAEDPGQTILLFTAFRDAAVERAAADLNIEACFSKADLHLLLPRLAIQMNQGGPS